MSTQHEDFVLILGSVHFPSQFLSISPHSLRHISIEVCCSFMWLMTATSWLVHEINANSMNKPTCLTGQKHTYLNDQHTGQQQEKVPHDNRSITEKSVIMCANEQALHLK